MLRRIAIVVSLCLPLAACSSEGPSFVAADEPTLGPGATAQPSPSAEPTLPDNAGNDGAGDDDAGHDGVAAGDATPTSAPTATPDIEPTPEPSPPAAPAVEATSTPAPTGSGCTASRAGVAVAERTALADLDGDGAGDQVIAYAIDESGRLTWRLRVETAAGESLDTELDLRSDTGVGIEPLGGADVDGDGSTDELFTMVGAGASARIVAIHVRQGCDLVQATISGSPATFPIGGSIGNLGGLECVDSDQNGVNNSIVAWVGVADFGGAEGDYLVDGVEYELRGSELRQLGARSARANLIEADFVYGQLTCGTVNL